MKKTYPTYEEAQRILKEHGINSQTEYRRINKELGLSSNPHTTYKDAGWIDWPNYFGRKAITYPSYEEAQRIVQNEGINSSKEYQACYKRLELPSLPEGYYKDKGWLGWAEFLGKKTTEHPIYEEAQRIVSEAGIKSQSEYWKTYKNLGLPVNPARFYKDKGWINWYEFLSKKKYSFPTYEEAQRRVQVKGIKSSTEYFLSYKELKLPSNPHLNYKNQGWINWSVFLGKTTCSLPSYEEAQKIVKVNGIKSQAVYNNKHRKLGLPAAPDVYYRDRWIDWYDFLGKSKVISQEDRKYNLFKKLEINPALLRDAPLKVLFIFFSKFRGISDDITSLLSTSSYEERLNWVKEQLNSLKDCSLSKDKSSGEEPDELSAMESVLEENDDVKKSLSEEESERFKTIWENYVHGVINRELISEYDD